MDDFVINTSQEESREYEAYVARYEMESLYIQMMSDAIGEGLFDE